MHYSAQSIALSLLLPSRRDLQEEVKKLIKWLNSKGIYLAKKVAIDPGVITNVNIEEMLAEYFDIDLDKVEKEKRQMLEKIRNVGD